MTMNMRAAASTAPVRKAGQDAILRTALAISF